MNLRHAQAFATWAALAVVAVLIPLRAAFHRPLWRDEAFTAFMVQYDLPEIVRRTAGDVHPPLYYLLLKLWTMVFGTSELGLRSLSIVLSLAVLLVLWRMVRRFFAADFPAWPLAFVAAAPFTVRYATEARMYMLAALFVALSTYMLLLMLQEQRGPTLRQRLLYGLCLAAAFYSQYFAVLIVPVHLVYALVHILVLNRGLRPRQVAIRYIKLFAVPAAVSLALVLPWLPVLAHQGASVQEDYWILPPTAETYRDALGMILFYLPWQELRDKGIVTHMLRLALAGALLWLLRPKGNPVAWPLVVVGSLAIVIPGLIMVLLSQPPLQPIFDVRYFAPFTPLLYLAVGVAAWRLLGVWRRLWPLAWGVVIALALALNYGHEMMFREMQDIGAGPAIAAYLTEHRQPGEPIITYNIYSYYETDYYVKEFATPRVHPAEEPWSNRESILIYDKPERFIQDWREVQGGRVWVINNVPVPPPADGWQTGCGYTYARGMSVQCFETSSRNK